MPRGPRSRCRPSSARTPSPGSPSGWPTTSASPPATAATPPCYRAWPPARPADTATTPPPPAPPIRRSTTTGAWAATTTATTPAGSAPTSPSAPTTSTPWSGTTSPRCWPTPVDTVTAHSFDRHGNRLWRDAHTLFDSEHARYAVGDVAVPYGRCTEPSNVKAGGGACPVRFRCAGCDHFRTDISHLPELTAYLDDLLRTRERLQAGIEGVDEWARADAVPSTEEITRIRRLINR